MTNRRRDWKKDVGMLSMLEGNVCPHKSLSQSKLKTVEKIR